MLNAGETMQQRLLQFAFLVAMTPVLVILCMASHRALPSKAATPQLETRCGWFSNPTPGNVWLNDRDGEWIIGIQGGYQTEGDWPWPDFKKGQWVRTNAGSYGYGCACLQVRVDKETNHVLEIKGARPRPLAACRKEPSLKKLERTFK
jgi:uncharacterized protein DUF4087